MSTIDQIVKKTQSESSEMARKTLRDFVTKIDKELRKYFDKEIKNSFGVSKNERDLSKHIWEHIKEHNLRPAKRLRGSFIYFGYKLLGGKNDKEIMKASLSIELIHTALLMHDDFMDQDIVRRGLPTTHKYYETIGKSEHYGASMAVNVGDMALLAGFEILGRTNFEIYKKIEAQNRMLRGIINTGSGQAFDVTLENKGVAKEKDIFDLHLAKTAIYTYENPLHVGAILAGGKEADLEILSKYAIPGGVAFQLQDDILGIFGDEEKTGKAADSDLKQGKMTLLIIKALENGSKSQVKKLKQIWGNKNLTSKDAKIARQIIVDTGSLEYSKKVSINWAKKAQKAIALMNKRGWNKEAVNYLNGIAQYMVEREL